MNDFDYWEELVLRKLHSQSVIRDGQYLPYNSDAILLGLKLFKAEAMLDNSYIKHQENGDDRERQRNDILIATVYRLIWKLKPDLPEDKSL